MPRAVCDDEHAENMHRSARCTYRWWSTTLRKRVERLGFDTARLRSGDTWRRTGTALACIVACAVAALPSPSALAAATSSTNPEQLWRAYPLEQTSTSGGVTSSRPPVSRPSAGAPSSAAGGREPGSRLPWIVFLIGAGVGFAVVTLAFRRKPVSAARGAGTVAEGERGAAAASPEAKPPTGASMFPAPTAAEQRSPPASRRAARAGARSSAPVKPLKPAPRPNGGLLPEGGRKSGPRAPSRPRAAGPPRSLAPPPLAPKPQRLAAGAPRHDFADRGVPSGSQIAPSGGGAERDDARTTAARKGPVCQIRWLPRGRGSCFCAVTIDADGVERTLATSPRLDWRGPSPPDQSREAQAALRQLAKQLRDNGWRPMRAKGRDFNEQQWYARRFRRPEPAAEENGTGANKRRVR
jgi:hypothetical protein